MASAVLASRNEPFMGKTPFSNSHLISNPNPNPNSIHRRQIHPQANGRRVDESPAVNQSQSVSVSDEGSSFNRRSIDSSSHQPFNQGRYVTFNISSYSTKELNELKKRLISELDQIRSLTSRIESGEFNPPPNLASRDDDDEGRNKKKKSKNLSNKKITGTKRPMPVDSSRELKRTASEIGGMMRMCGQVLTKLMKHKHGWIFNSPVDVVGMGLHDYYQIVKHPMDLGTVKSKIGKNFYASPLEFASDVRLTFNNALLYNPKGHDVYMMAEQLLLRFEEMFRPVYKKFQMEEPQQKQQQQPQKKGIVVDELQGSSWSNISTPERAKKSNPFEVSRKPERMQVPSRASNPVSNPPLVQSPVPTPSPKRVSPVKPMARTKQPKPKAKDPNKREMSIEEKHRLGIGLQSLPEEKMTQVVQIIRKRNGNLTEDGDEIELDIEAVDTETLWELDRFVTNWKKMVSKIKRQALMGNNATTSEGEVVHVNSDHNAVASVKRSKKGEAGEEDVDIGDDIPMSSFPPVEIEKDDGHATSSSSSSSSSGSDSSSSSDSDSGSSSGSDSDADNAHARDLGSKEFSKV